ncbi:tRNA adenosine deaminase-associated protein [Nocardioides sp. AE5]|uniref:tRNA adenosine deaminase-associated protein n=1 Tax=Nocardioides sp. AE5 TaxID=2962573 RepID=UPI0028813BF8|nr:tRNA adenosine deaminase-associated protein [Nocardioides sp. AE5]MDT0200449.1 tRNA adenosine deaminase-associated protein [Nocardioides sp. AE5]
MDEVPEVDFAFAVFRDDGDWEVEDLTDQFLESVESLAAGLRRFPGEGGAMALIGLDEDVFVIVRVEDHVVRVLLSDVTAADDWELARSVLEHLNLPFPDDDDDSEPAGDLAILADLGMPAADLADLIDDHDLFPDEVLSEVAEELGFADEFDEALGLASA